MSQENVEIVRSGYDAFLRGDLDAVIAAADPAIELEASDAFFDAPQTYRGHEGMRQFYALQAEVFEDFQIEVLELFDAGDRVLAIVRSGGLGRGSGVEVFGRFGHLWTLSSGRAIHFKEFKEPEHAFEAAGLRE